MLIVKIVGTDGAVQYLKTDSLFDIPEYVDKNYDRTFSPYKLSNIQIDEVVFKCEVISIDKATNNVNEVKFVDYKYKTIRRLMANHKGFDETEVNNQMNEVFDGAKKFLLNKDGSSCLVVNCFSEL